MRALSQRQVTTCEESKRPRCRCRCHGQLHGIRREGFVQIPMFHIKPEEQHLHLPPDVVEAAQSLGFLP